MKQFSVFLEDIVKIFPDDKEIITAKVYFEGLKKVNPRLLITSWKMIIADNYEEQILDGDFNFFIEKDYKEDIEEVAKRRNWDEDYSYINENIETLRSKIANESEYNKNISMKYLINLTKLSKLYI